VKSGAPEEQLENQSLSWWLRFSFSELIVGISPDQLESWRSRFGVFRSLIGKNVDSGAMTLF
jgi:hypothetical protein